MTSISTSNPPSPSSVPGPGGVAGDARPAATVDNSTMTPPGPSAGDTLRNANGAPRLAKPGADNANLSTAMLELQSLLAGEQIKQSKQQIESNQAERKARYEEAAQKLEKAIDKLKEAEKWKNIANNLSRLSKIAASIGGVAGAVGSVAALIGGATTIVSAVSAGSLSWIQIGFLTVGAIGLGIAALSTAAAIGLEASNRTGLTDKAIDAAIDEFLDKTNKDMSEQDREWIKLGVKIAMQLAITAVGMVGAVMSTGVGAAAAVTKVSGFCAKIADAIAAAVKGLVQGMAKAAPQLIATGIAQFVQGAAQTGIGATEIVQSIKRFEADNEKADAAADKVLIQKLSALLEEESERIQEMMEQLDATVARVIASMRADAETNSLIARQMV